jgi:hypothetical protein
MLFLSFLLALTVGYVQHAEAAGTSTVYPFPASLASNSDFQVWVENTSSPVWTAPGMAATPKAVTSFAFTGTVTVKVQYKSNFTSANIMPSQYGITYTKPAANQLQFTLNDYKKSKIIIRIDNDPNKELFLFGDPPVATPPAGATVYQAGAHYPANHELTMQDNQTIFLMPGAVLHARIDTANNSNLKILGPGIVVAYDTGVNPNESEFENNMVFYKSNNVELRDFILVRNFNDNLIHQLVVRNTDNVSIDNVKVISDARCSDGLSLGGNNGVDVKNFFSVSGDNNLVIGWWGKTDNVTIDNYIAYFPEHAGIAQTSAIFAQGIEGTKPGEDTSSIGTVRITNFYAIKQTNVLGSIWGKIQDNIDNFTIENLYTEPGSTRDNLLYFDLNVSSNKNFNLKNVYFDKTTGGYLSDKYYVRFDNVYYKGNLVANTSTANVTGSGKVQVLNGTSGKHYEFENGQLNGPIAANKNYASFGKAVAVMNSVGSFAEVTIDVPVAGDYILDIAYANGSGADAAQSVYVNGIYKFQASFPKTNAGWDQSASSWKKLSGVGTVNLQAGTNKIKIQKDSNDIYTADLDFLEVNFKPIHVEMETGTVGGGALIVNKNYASGLKAVGVMDAVGSYVNLTVNVPSTGNYKVDFRYANGTATDATKNVYANGVFQFSANLPTTGSWDTATSWVNLTHAGTLALQAGTNTIRIQTDASNVSTSDFDYLELHL